MTEESINWVAQIEKFRMPNKAYAKPINSRFKPRWHTVYKNTKGYYIVLRGNRVYEEHWKYNKVGQ